MEITSSNKTGTDFNLPKLNKFKLEDNIQPKEVLNNSGYGNFGSQSLVMENEIVDINQPKM